jgi:hypothetical protein
MSVEDRLQKLSNAVVEITASYGAVVALLIEKKIIRDSDAPRLAELRLEMLKEIEHQAGLP